MVSMDARPSTAPDAIAVRKWTVEVLISMMVLSMAAIGMRLLSRHIRNQKLWWDDWLCIVAMVSILLQDGM